MSTPKWRGKKHKCSTCGSGLTHVEIEKYVTYCEYCVARHESAHVTGRRKGVTRMNLVRLGGNHGHG